MLLESVSLALLGGIVGTGLAFGGLKLLVALAPGNMPRLADIGLDVPVLLFTLVVSVAAGLLFGAIPVFKYARGRVAMALRGGGRTPPPAASATGRATSSSWRRLRWRSCCSSARG
jgi:ABC-type antimicrobial peptide transport system permease subunit